MCVGAFVFSFNKSSLPDSTQNGYRCTGTEAELRECPRGDPDTNSAGWCLSRLRLVCKNGSSSITSDAPTPISTTESMDQTTGSTTTELDMPQSSSQQAILQTGSTSDEELSSTISSVANDTSQQHFLSGSRLYIFIGVVGAVLVAIMVLVQIPLTYWYFLKYFTKEVSSKSQESKGQDDQLDGSSKTPTTSANTRLKNHHQLQKSPPMTTNPIYYSLENGGSGQRLSGLYSELDKGQVYAQLETCGSSSSPTAQAEPTYQCVENDPSYQLLQHKNSIVSKGQRKPRPLDKERIRQQKLEFLQLQEFQATKLKAARLYDMPEGNKDEDATRNAEVNMYHSIENPGDHVYQTIEAPPDYATLENPNEPVSHGNRRGTLGKKDSSDSQKAAPPIPSRDRTPSKSSITSPRDIYNLDRTHPRH